MHAITTRYLSRHRCQTLGGVWGALWAFKIRSCCCSALLSVAAGMPWLDDDDDDLAACCAGRQLLGMCEPLPNLQQVCDPNV